MALTLVWWGWVVVRPLERPVAGEERAIPAIPVIPGEPGFSGSERDISVRQALVEALGRENLFAADRQPWPRRRPTNASDGANAQASKAVDGTAAPHNATGGIGGGAAHVGLAGAGAAVTPRESLPDDVKKALGALELKAVRRDREGKGVAMITFVHGADRPVSRAFRAGDEFSEETNPQAPWRVEAVEVLRRRVVLSRSGVLAALPLYKGLGDGPLATEADSASMGARAPGEVVVEGRTRDEVAVELRAKGLSEVEITALMTELDRQLEASGESPVRTLAEIVAPKPEGSEQAAQGPRRTPPAGMEAVLKMMAEQSAQVSAAAKDTPTKDRPAPARRGARENPRE